MNRVAFVLALLSISLLVAGCSGHDDLQPPTLYLGQHECDQCRMIIDDGRFAAAMIVEDSRGRRRSLLFDDIGCLLWLESENDSLDGGRTLVRYVRDAETAQWLDADAATYLHAETLITPMAFHIAAFRTAQSARAVQAQHSPRGEVIDLPEVRRRFEVQTLRTFVSDVGERGEGEQEHEP